VEGILVHTLVEGFDQEANPVAIALEVGGFGQEEDPVATALGVGGILAQGKMVPILVEEGPSIDKSRTPRRS